MGAHTLGGAAPDASGYAGVWVPDEALMFNEGFYSAMIDSSLTYEPFVRNAVNTLQTIILC